MGWQPGYRSRQRAQRDSDQGYKIRIGVSGGIIHVHSFDVPVFSVDSETGRIATLQLGRVTQLSDTVGFLDVSKIDAISWRAASEKDTRDARETHQG